MPIIKHSAVHVTPLKAIEYVINGDKTDDCKYVSGINIGTTAKEAYQDFCLNFEMHIGERFNKQALSENGKKDKIRLHHYIQSFQKGETTPEEAHKIGEEWARLMFSKGRDLRFQVLICTHVDKSHIHNHILVSALDLDGKAWYDNKSTIKRAREISDRLAKQHGLSVIENPKKGTMLPYSEYIAKQNNNSWKDKLKRDIDIIVLQPDVKDIQDLAKKLQILGYEVSGRKYLHVKRAIDKNHKPMSTLKLGDGYGTEELRNRIEMKNIIMPLSRVNSYSGIQREYAFCLRQVQFLLYRKQASSYKVSYGTVRKNSELLCYICNNNIHSIKDFEDEVNSADEKYRELTEKKKELESEISAAEKVLALDKEEYFSLRDKPELSPADIRNLKKNFQPLLDNHITDNENYEAFRQKYLRLKSRLDETTRELEMAKAVRKEVTEHYKTYLSQMETDYDRMLREQREFYEFNDDGITETPAGDISDTKYFAEIYRGSVTERTAVDTERILREYNKKYGLDDNENNHNYRSQRYER